MIEIGIDANQSMLREIIGLGRKRMITPSATDDSTRTPLFAEEKLHRIRLTLSVRALPLCYRNGVRRKSTGTRLVVRIVSSGSTLFLLETTANRKMSVSRVSAR